MFEHILDRVRNLVRVGDYYVTAHDQTELYDDDLTMLDIERAILSGHIVEKQRDRTTGEAKYVIQGTAAGGIVEIVIKFEPDGELSIITIYCLEKME